MANLEEIRGIVERIHSGSDNPCMNSWFYHGHVEVVASYTEKIACDVDADAEIAVLGALFHDIARCWGVRDDPALMDESLAKAEEVLDAHGYSKEQIEQVKQVIIPHSCRENMPETIEAKVMATADALAHD